MNPENAIEVKDVVKDFRVYLDKGNMLKERILFPSRNRYEDRHILRGISFECKKGETVGLIGRNGCGKSTTLKLLSRIIRPNSGTVSIRGRVSSLIELGAGFHPDMSGRENIFINASIFGLKQNEIEKRLEDIIRFSELEEFIDNPVRTYSSGMYMRLAFSVAINVNADVLLIDEILGVGDVSFQKKCFQKLREIKEAGTTIIVVSHAMGQLYDICDRLIWIDEGLIKEEGVPLEIGRHYMDSMEDERIARMEADKEAEKQSKSEEEKEQYESILKIVENPFPEVRRDGTREVEFCKVQVFGETQLAEKRSFSPGERCVLKLVIQSHIDISQVQLQIGIVRDDWLLCYETRKKISITKDNLKIIEFTFERLDLLPGDYYISLDLNGDKNEVYDGIRCICRIKIEGINIHESGVYSMKHSWVER